MLSTLAHAFITDILNYRFKNRFQIVDSSSPTVIIRTAASLEQGIRKTVLFYSKILQSADLLQAPVDENEFDTSLNIFRLMLDLRFSCLELKGIIQDLLVKTYLKRGTSRDDYIGAVAFVLKGTNEASFRQFQQMIDEISILQKPENLVVLGDLENLESPCCGQQTCTG